MEKPQELKWTGSLKHLIASMPRTPDLPQQYFHILASKTIYQLSGLLLFAFSLVQVTKAFEFHCTKFVQGIEASNSKHNGSVKGFLANGLVSGHKIRSDHRESLEVTFTFSDVSALC